MGQLHFALPPPLQTRLPLWLENLAYSHHLSEFPHKYVWPSYMTSSAAKAFPPKHTSMRHCFEGMNFPSLFLHCVVAISSLAWGQLLMSGLFEGTMGVFWPGKIRSATATPCVPKRLRTSIRSSSAALPL